MSDVICINDSYSNDCLEFWKLHKVVYPKKDKMYTIRDVIRNSEGNTGIFLEEIKNPKIPIKHPILGVTLIEPYFNINRFRFLDGKPVTYESLKEFIKESIKA